MKNNYRFSPAALIQTTPETMDGTATKKLWADVENAKDLFDAPEQFDTDGQAIKSTFIQKLLQSELLRMPTIVSSNQDLATSLDSALRAQWTANKEHIGYLVLYVRKLFQANCDFLPSEDQAKNFLALFAQELRGTSQIHLACALNGVIGNQDIDDTGLTIRLEIDEENNILFQAQYKDLVFMPFDDAPDNPQILNMYQIFCLTKAGEVIPRGIIIETDAELLNEKCDQLQKKIIALGRASPTTEALTNFGLWPKAEGSNSPSRASWSEASTAPTDEQAPGKRPASR